MLIRYFSYASKKLRMLFLLWLQPSAKLAVMVADQLTVIFTSCTLFQRPIPRDRRSCVWICILLYFSVTVLSDWLSVFWGFGPHRTAMWCKLSVNVNWAEIIIIKKNQSKQSHVWGFFSSSACFWDLFSFSMFSLVWLLLLVLFF